MAPDTGELVTAFYNAGWWVRRYAPRRTPAMRAQRAQAIERLGLAVRDAFTRSDDFEPLLIALVDSLKQRDEPPF